MEKPLNWDIFCRVIDNFGDVGVCWRLACDLADRGHHVRLWLDDTSALQWMAPGGHPRIHLVAWAPGACTDAAFSRWPTDVVIEGFGCGPDSQLLEALESQYTTQPATASTAARSLPVWINLEYLSAEDYVERSHGLASHSVEFPVLGGNKFFFYPGFTSATGGLIRETWTQDLRNAQNDTFLSALLACTADDQPSAAVVRISLFCYDNAPLWRLWRQLLALCTPQGSPVVQLVVTSGKSSQLVRQWLSDTAATTEAGLRAAVMDAIHQGRLVISFLPLLTQRQYDALLHRCDLNFVRGEDSLVRALWAKRPFIWHIYPQEGAYHLVKLNAFVDRLELPRDWAQCLMDWNSAGTETLTDTYNSFQGLDIAAWSAKAQQIAHHLSAQTDLVTQLVQFVGEKR